MRNKVVLPVAAVLLVLMQLAAAFNGSGQPAEAQTFPTRARLVQIAADSVQPPVTATPTRTPTLASTSTPFATPTATKTPVVTPTSQPQGVYAHHSQWYTSITDSIWVVGLVTNGRSQAVSYVEITANFYSSSGQLLATDFGFSDITTMAAGSNSPCSVLLIDPPPGISSVTIGVTDYDTTPFWPPVTGLTPTVTNVYRSITGTVHVVGTVKNNSNTFYTYVEPIGAFVDSSGYVIRTDFTFTSPDDLAPGATGTFDMLFIGAPAGMEYENFLIWVDANYP